MHEAFLEVKPSSGRTFSYPLERPVTTIGRDASADLVIDDPLLSKLHARIEVKSDTWVLIDEGSRNGTFIAGKRAPEKTAQTLKDGDDITLGLTALKFRLGATDDKAPPTRRLMRATQEHFSAGDLLGNVGSVDLPEPLRRLLVRVAEDVLPESEPLRIYESTLRIATDLLDSDRAAVLTLPREGELTIAAKHPAAAEFDLPEHFYAAVVEQRGVVLLREDKERGNASAIALPLLWPTGVAGVLYAEKVGGKSFDAKDAAFGSVIASLVGPALYQAQRLKTLLVERHQPLSQPGGLDTGGVADGGTIDRHGSGSSVETESQPLKDAVNAFERQFILRVLAEQAGHRTRTAKALGLSRQALSEKLRKYGVTDKDEENDSRGE